MELQAWMVLSRKQNSKTKKTFCTKSIRKSFNALEIKQQSWNGRGQIEEKEQMNQLNQVETEEIQKNRGEHTEQHLKLSGKQLKLVRLYVSQGP
jgi:hypothetical protein